MATISSSSPDRQVMGEQYPVTLKRRIGRDDIAYDAGATDEFRLLLVSLNEAKQQQELE